MLLVVADMLFVVDIVLELLLLVVVLLLLVLLLLVLLLLVLLDIVLGLLVDADVLSVVVGEVFCPIAAKPEPKMDRTRKVRFIKITFFGVNSFRTHHTLCKYNA